jgi:hypothetical protein
VGEEAGPVFAGAEIAALVPSLAPEILLPFGPVPVVRVAPEPGGERLLLVGFNVLSGHALVELGLRGEEPLERGAGELAGVPRVIGLDLGISVVRVRGAGGDEKDGCEKKRTRHKDAPVDSTLPLRR